jgi:hypothetical protein
MRNPARLDITAHFLITAGATRIRHGRGTLFEHLVGTAAILIHCAAHDDVVIGGFTHSIYGTQSFRRRMFCEQDREAVRRVIGPESEAMAWRFSGLTGNASHPAPDHHRPACVLQSVMRTDPDTCHQFQIALANLLDQQALRHAVSMLAEIRRIVPAAHMDDVIPARMVELITTASYGNL